MAKKETALIEALRLLLAKGKTNTQDSICTALEKLGFEINQTKISRLLRKIGAMKVISAEGQTVYSLPKEPAPPSMKTSLRELIFNIVANETLIVIYTHPGSASMVARLLDYKQSELEILGTIAGDDTLVVIPKSIKLIPALLTRIQTLFDM